MSDQNNNEYSPLPGRKARMEHFFDKSHEGLIFHIAGTITDANPALARMSGFTTDEIIGTNVFKWITPGYHELVKKNMAIGSEDMYEIALLHKSGENIPVYLRPVNALVDGHQERLVVIQEIRALKKAEQTQRQIEEKVHALSNFDPDTGLPNRHLFNHWMDEMTEAHKKSQQSFAVIHITIEKMKMLNEIFGRDIGDQLLNQWASRLCNLLRTTVEHRSARIGGIRFAVALPNIENTDSVIRLLQDLRTEVEANYQIGEHQIDNLVGSYGIAIFPDDGDDVEALMSRAEIACRHARESNTESIHCFTEDMNIHTLDKFKFEMRLKGALDRNEMELYYQPKVDAITEQVVGYEALIRWIDPEKGIVPPGDFIPLAEETGLIIPIGEWVITGACEQLARLQKLPGATPKISINISSLQFQQSNLIDIVQQSLTLFEVDPKLLDLELTESAVMDDVEASISILNNLKALGVSISIDDFGTGYSSLSYLKRFPIDTLKIDRSFVIDLTTNPQDESIARAIIALAKSLELETIAEGVETPEQLRLLREMECDLIQGYIFGKPVPAEQAFAS